MNHSGAESDKRTAVEVTKDKNGIGQVVLRNPRGASARVRSFYLYFIMYFVFFKLSSSNWLNNSSFIFYLNELVDARTLVLMH